MTEIEVMAGSHITNACRAAVASAPAFFTFNGVRVEANPGDTEAALVAAWTAEMDRRAEEYRNSPQGKAAAERRKAEADALQRKYDETMASVGDLTDAATAMRFVRDISTASDHIDVLCDLADPAKLLGRAGYVGNAHVGDIDATSSPRKVAEYIAGQFINCASKGPIPPVAVHFAEKWLAENTTEGK